MSRRIACFGSGFGNPGEPDYETMVEVGTLLAKSGTEVWTGGYGGMMEAASRGAKEAGGVAWGFIASTLGPRGNKFLTRTTNCNGEMAGRQIQDKWSYACYIRPNVSVTPPVETQYGVRLASLMTADAFIFSAMASAENLAELMSIVSFNADVWRPQKRVIVLRLSAPCNHSNITAGLLSELQNIGLLPHGSANYLGVASTPEQAVEWVI